MNSDRMVPPERKGIECESDDADKAHAGFIEDAAIVNSDRIVPHEREGIECESDDAEKAHAGIGLGIVLERGVMRVIAGLSAFERDGIREDLGVGTCIVVSGRSVTRPSADTRIWPCSIMYASAGSRLLGR